VRGGAAGTGAQRLILDRESTATMDLPKHQLSMTVLMTPDMADFAGKVHGGAILKRKRLRVKPDN
jgi:hypothetical protein